MKLSKFMLKKNDIIVGLIGNPNVGKSTLFNTITGARQRVGNWPGKTVEKKEGELEYENRKIKIVDLPGSYSLNAYSEEENVSSDFILLQKPDLLIQIVDAQNLSRNLFLTTQLIELRVPMILVLNMNHLAKKKGTFINIDFLSKKLGIQIIEIDARKKSAVKPLLEAILKVIKHNKISHLKIDIAFPDIRYKFIKDLENYVIKRDILKKGKTFEEKIDRVVINKYFGIPLFLVVSWLMFQVTFVLSKPIIDLIGVIFKLLGNNISYLLSHFGASKLFTSLITKGIVGGVGGVLVFVPVISILFFFISILEDSGYMARVAYIMDRFMRNIGLHGKAFIPLILGFSCNVPGIMATKTLETKKDRLLTTLINPFMSCSTKLPVYILFAGIFFPKNQGLVIFSLYLLGILVAISMGFILNKYLIKEEVSPFIIELPPYHMPSITGIFIHVWTRVSQFIKKAGTIILAFSIIIWFLASFPNGVEYGSQKSYFGNLGQIISPVLSPLGFSNWKMAVALLFGVVAKEVIIGTFNTLYSGVSLVSALRHDFTPLSAYSFMVFILLYAPCVATLATVKKETNSWKWPIFMIIYTTVIAWFMAFIIYQTGLIFGLG